MISRRKSSTTGWPNTYWIIAATLSSMQESLNFIRTKADMEQKPTAPLMMVNGCPESFVHVIPVLITFSLPYISFRNIQHFLLAFIVFPFLRQ